jgi:hypothetical protein
VLEEAFEGSTSVRIPPMAEPEAIAIA